MYFIFFILPLILLIPLVIYFYYFLKRILSLCRLDTQKRSIQITIGIIVLLFVFPSYNLFGFWALVVLHMFAFGILFDLLYWVIKKLRRKSMKIDKIYQVGILPILCTVIILGYGYWNMAQVSCVSYTIQTEKAIHQSYRVALITDLHFGNTMDQAKLNQYCQQISSKNPDIVLLGGDIVDEQSTYQQMQKAFWTLSKIKNRFGIYYVYGNHDRALYAQNPPFTKQQLKSTIEDNGIHLLSDQAVKINQDMMLIGREDRSIQQRQTIQELTKKLSNDDFLLLLDHQPTGLDDNDQRRIDLQLSGHTHGGQIFPVGIMIDWLGFGEMNYGYRQMSHMQVIVSSGIGGWGYPLRTGSHSEYVIVDINKK